MKTKFHPLLGIWLLILLAGPILSNTISADTTLLVVSRDGETYAQVEGTRLDLPPEALQDDQNANLRLPTLPDLKIEPASASQYWQPAEPGPFYPVGLLYESLQSIRPPSKWLSARVNGDGSASYTLRAGRSLAVLPFPAESGGNLALLVRPERAAISWNTFRAGQPDQELATARYRPSGWVSLADLLSEFTLIAWAASLLILLAWLASLALARFLTPSPSPTPDRAPNFAFLARFNRFVCPAHLSIAFFIAGSILASVICLAVLEGIPHVQDEVAYIFQARIFALGRSWVPAPAAPEFFASSFVEIFDGRWFSKYPPGYPLLLVPGLWAGVPWLIGPLSAGVSLGLVYATGLRMYGRQVAAWAALLGLISPWLLFMSASYMSHTVTMMWIALFLYAIVCMNSTPDNHTRFIGRPVRWALLAGFAMGMAFITREWTAFGIGLGAAVWAIGDIALSRGQTLRKLKLYSCVVLGFLPPLAFLLYENHQLTGDWLRLAQDLVGSYDTPGFGPGHGDAIGHTPAMGLYNALVYLRTLATVFDGWPAPFALAPAFLGLFAWLFPRSKKQLAWDLLLWLSLMGLVGAYFLWWSATTIYGPRYWYEAMPFLLLMSARGLDLLGRFAASPLRGGRYPQAA